MRILYVGDVVGRSGRAVLLERIVELRQRLRLDALVVNGENAAAGFGITIRICEEFLNAGVDVVTLGNHSWDQKELVGYIGQQPRLLRPLNLQPGAPGSGLAEIRTAIGFSRGQDARTASNTSSGKRRRFSRLPP